LNLFVDTWGWLTLADARESEHKRATHVYEERSRAGRRVVTSDYVLSETFTLLFRRLPFEYSWRFLAAVLASPNVHRETVTQARFLRAVQLRRKFADKPKISFTDLSSMVIMDEMKLADILTADEHFAQVGMGFRLVPN
jgi:predicted nucleic acid-binding protein